MDSVRGGHHVLLTNSSWHLTHNIRSACGCVGVAFKVSMCCSHLYYQLVSTWPISFHSGRSCASGSPHASEEETRLLYLRCFSMEQLKLCQVFEPTAQCWCCFFSKLLTHLSINGTLVLAVFRGFGSFGLALVKLSMMLNIVYPFFCGTIAYQYSQYGKYYAYDNALLLL